MWNETRVGISALSPSIYVSLSLGLVKMSPNGSSSTCFTLPKGKLKDANKIIKAFVNSRVLCKSYYWVRSI